MTPDLPRKGPIRRVWRPDYIGVLGNPGTGDNCQVLVTSHYVYGGFDWPITARPYLPVTEYNPSDL